MLRRSFMGCFFAFKPIPLLLRGLIQDDVLREGASRNVNVSGEDPYC